jgi:hypothetical protein
MNTRTFGMTEGTEARAFARRVNGELLAIESGWLVSWEEGRR